MFYYAYTWLFNIHQDTYVIGVKGRLFNIYLIVIRCLVTMCVSCGRDCCTVATSLNQIARLLGKVRRIVSFFHHSPTAGHILERKQELLGLAKHRLIKDMTTRWNSRYGMLERYVEQQTAVYAALTERALKKKRHQHPV